MSRSQRQLDRQVRRHAANRRIGHDHAYAIVVAPYAWRVGGVLAVAYGLWWLWSHTGRDMLVSGLTVATGLCIFGWVVWRVRSGGASGRIMARATGRAPSRVGHALLAGAILFGLAAVMTWRSM